MFDMIAHLTRQAAFSRATFGPGARTKGVIDHVEKELREVEKVYAENDGSPRREPDVHVHTHAAREWADVAILGLDGLTRAIWAAHRDWSSADVAAYAVQLLLEKQGKNERRNWPDWRTAPEGKAIEHTRGHED